MFRCRGQRSGMWVWRPSVCPGEVGSGSPTRTCANTRIHSGNSRTKPPHLAARGEVSMQEDKIRESLVELLYRNSYGVVASNVLISLAAAYVLRNTVPASW